MKKPSHPLTKQFSELFVAYLKLSGPLKELELTRQTVEIRGIVQIKEKKRTHGNPRNQIPTQHPQSSSPLQPPTQ